MPIYEYSCESCLAEFEDLQRSMGDGPKPVCPQCESKKTKRKLSVFAVASANNASSSANIDAPSCGRCGGAPGSCQM